MTAPAPQHSLERAIARFVVEFDATALDDALRAAARRLVEDQLAVQIGCASLPWSKQILDLTLASARPGRSTIVRSARKVSAVDAAFVNAIYGHGFEYDDAHPESASHPGCCVVPTALALGEELDAALEDVLVAMIVGYEVYARIGCMAAPELLSRGFHPHAVLANFGAAAVAAKLKRFDEETTLHALAIASSHASGLTEYTSSGGSVKRVHAGIGVRNGMAAADMARAGITGPTAFLTGNKGFYRTFLQKTVGHDQAARFARSAPFEIEKLWIKPYCCCGCIHAYIDATRTLAGKAADIVAVDVAIQRTSNVVVGNLNASAYTPATIEQVQFSLPMQMAFALRGMGNGYQVHQDYMSRKFDLDPADEIVKTAKLVRIEHDPGLDEKYPGKFVASLVARYRDGTSERVFVENSTGTAPNPISDDELDAKFRELTVGALGEKQSGELLQRIKRLSGPQKVSSLATLYSG